MSRGVLAVALVCLAGLACSQQLVIPVADGSYALHYNLVSYSFDDPTRTSKGSFDLQESGGHLRCRYTAPNALSFDFLYDGKMSFTSLLGKNQAWMIKGFTYGELEHSVYMPFNFHSYKIYVPHTLKPGSTISEKMGLEPPNVNIVLKSGIGEDRVIGGIYRGPRPQTPGIESITYGPAFAPIGEFKYSHFKAVGGMLVPADVSVTWSKHQAVGERKTSVPVMHIDLHLESGVSGKFEGIDKLDVGHFLQKGMLVSYSAGPGEEAGVLYDPSAGSFDDQLKSALAIRKRHAGQVVIAGTTQPGSSVVPLAFTAVFGVAAIVLLAWGYRRSAR